MICPLARKVTLPLEPWVTETITRPAFSKLSALPPPAPVSALKTMAVSSLVETASATMSATGVTFIAIVSLSLRIPSVVSTVKLNGVEGEPVL